MNDGLYTALSTGRLVVTAGSGGVGKTTIAAALALGSAVRVGRRVAVVTIDPARRLANAMGLEALSGELREVSLPSSAKGSLHAMMLDVKTTSDAMVKRFSRDEKAAAAILENDYYRQFAGALSGSQEYMAVEAVRSLLEDQNFDLVVLDTPPATHALDFFDAPRRLIDGLDSAPMRLLSQYGGSSGNSLTGRIARKGSSLMLRGLGRMTGGPFLEELAEFLKLFGTILEALKQASIALEILFREDNVHFFLVLTPQHGVLKSALGFKTELARRSLPFKGFILNKTHIGADDNLPQADAVISMLETVTAGPSHDAIDHTQAIEAFLDQERVLLRRDRAIANKLGRASSFPVLCIPSMLGEVHDLESLMALSKSVLGPLEDRSKT